MGIFNVMNVTKIRNLFWSPFQFLLVSNRCKVQDQFELFFCQYRQTIIEIQVAMELSQREARKKRMAADFEKEWDEFHEKEWDPFIERHEA